MAQPLARSPFDASLSLVELDDVPVKQVLHNEEKRKLITL